MSDRQLPLGAPLARGNTSDIWPWTPTTVVKVLHPDIPRHWAAIEADIIWRVHAAGVPVPQVEGVVEVAGRPGIVLERVDGVTMWERMKATPGAVRGCIEDIVELQARLHGVTVEGLPDLARRLGSKIDEAVQIPAHDRRAVQAILAGLPTGNALCHGDVHPANVILAERGLVILDWFDAATGPALADIARSSLLMRPPGSRSAWPVHLPGATPQFLELVHCEYLAALARRGLIELEAFPSWEVVVAVARMSEPVPSADLVAIWQRWQAGGPSGGVETIERCLEGSGGLG
jgi:aminoglycoside phosphotransferase (APT) family kinase protein